jgi:Ribbon-helix-helix protein, copG family
MGATELNRRPGEVLSLWDLRPESRNQGERVEFRVSGPTLAVLKNIEAALDGKNRSEIMRDAIRLLGLHIMQAGQGERWTTTVAFDDGQTQEIDCLEFLKISRPKSTPSTRGKSTDDTTNMAGKDQVVLRRKQK